MSPDEGKFSLHHLEACVGDENHLLEVLTKGFGFYIACNRENTFARQLLLRRGSISIMITIRVNKVFANGHDEDNNGDPASTPSNSYPFLVCCQGQAHHFVDTFFNVALQVSDVPYVVAKVQSKGSQVLLQPKVFSDEFGSVTIAVVRSCCGNIIHTLIDKETYSGTFLPGFKISGPLSLLDDGKFSLNLGKTSDTITHVDHITYVCDVGETHNLMEWYEHCFGMKRFFTNRQESPSEGFVIEEGVGLRLKAMEFWRCAESGLSRNSSLNGKGRSVRFKLVIAEPIPIIAQSHVRLFLLEHQGPGLQHIGIHTSNIQHTVAMATENGVVFRKPPASYYEQSGKGGEIEACGVTLESLRRLGVLLDEEVDEETPANESKKFLLQVFTESMFERNTFFLEAIERRGARGFGAGNISALARSIKVQRQRERNGEIENGVGK